MVNVKFHPQFKKLFENIKDKNLKLKIIKHFIKIKENPEIAKPMRYSRKGTREVYIAPFRLSYAYVKSEDTILLLDLYHKDEQ